MSEGFGVGALTGLVGVGGGFAIVPALVLLGNIPMKQAIGTSLLIIAMNSGVGFLGYLGRVELNWALIGLIYPCGCFGNGSRNLSSAIRSSQATAKRLWLLSLGGCYVCSVAKSGCFCNLQPADATKTISTSVTGKITI